MLVQPMPMPMPRTQQARTKEEEHCAPATVFTEISYAFNKQSLHGATLCAPLNRGILFQRYTQTSWCASDESTTSAIILANI
eukprot:1160784-Pelagomonas_calceolata.AAC.11